MTVKKKVIDKPEIVLGELNMFSSDPRFMKPPVEVPQNVSSVPIGVYKKYEGVEIPEYQTEWSACFDLSPYFDESVLTVDCYNRMLMHSVKTVSFIREKENQRGVYIEPGETAVIPTGLIFDIPKGYQLQIYPRSGLASKKHLKNANCTGIIDADYYHEVFLLVNNSSSMRQSVCQGERVSQAEVLPVIQANFHILTKEPKQKTSRTGGLGHTGV